MSLRGIQDLFKLPYSGIPGHAQTGQTDHARTDHTSHARTVRTSHARTDMDDHARTSQAHHPRSDRSGPSSTLGQVQPAHARTGQSYPCSDRPVFIHARTGMTGLAMLGQVGLAWPCSVHRPRSVHTVLTAVLHVIDRHCPPYPTSLTAIATAVLHVIEPGTGMRHACLSASWPRPDMSLNQSRLIIDTKCQTGSPCPSFNGPNDKSMNKV